MGRITAQLSKDFYSDLVHIFWQSPYYRGDKTTFNFNTISSAMDSFLNDDDEYEDIINDTDWDTESETTIGGTNSGNGTYQTGQLSGTSTNWSSTTNSNTRYLNASISPGDGSFSGEFNETRNKEGKIKGIKGNWKQHRQWKRDKVAWFFKYAQYCAAMANNDTFYRYIAEFERQMTRHNERFDTYNDDYNSQMTRHNERFDTYNDDYNQRMQRQYEQQLRFNNMASDKDQGVYMNPNMKEDRYWGNERWGQAAFDVSMEETNKVNKIIRRIRNPINWERRAFDASDD